MSKNMPEPSVNLEKKLRELYDAISPEAGFTMRLRSQLWEQADQLAEGRTPRRGGSAYSWRQLGQWGMALVGLALVSIAIAFSIRLLPQNPKGPLTTDSPSSTPPFNTPSPSETPIPTERSILPVLSPDACQINENAPSDLSLSDPSYQPRALAGGGTMENGAFTFQIWLLCDPIFSRKNARGDYFSEIDGLGIYTHWRYHGPAMEGKIQEYAGIEPFVRLRSESGPVSKEVSSSDYQGLSFPSGLIPDFSKGNTTLRFIVKTRTPDGVLAGAALSFILQPNENGYRILDAHIQALPEEALRSEESEVNAPLPFPTIEASELYPELKEIRRLLEKWQEPLRASAGWVHVVVQTHYPEGEEMYNGLKDISNEAWYQLDEQGYVRTSVNIQRSPEGRILQQSYVKDGQGYNLTYGTSGPAPAYRFDLGAELYDELFLLVRAGKPIERSETIVEGKPVWLYTFTETFAEEVDIHHQAAVAHIKRTAIDRESGAVYYTENSLRTSDGQERTIWKITNQLVERVAQPPSEILRLLEQKPGAYMPPAPEGTPAPAGFDPTQSKLSLRSVMGDSFEQPSFWYGDIYAGEYLLGRVDLGGVPGGYCDRSPDGAKLAFSYILLDNERPTSSSLRWLDLGAINQVHNPAPELELISPVSWSPKGKLIAFLACQSDERACGLYVLDTDTDQARLVFEASGGSWAPLWKPDGKQIAFVSSENEAYTLHVVDVQSGKSIYQGKMDVTTWSAAADAPIHAWGAGMPKYARDRCFSSR